MDNTRRNYSGRLSDRDAMLDMINTEKQLSHLYDHAVMEASNLEIHTIMEEFQRDEHENSFTLFNAMQQRGWYNQSGQERQKQPSYNQSFYNTGNAGQRMSRTGRKRNYDLSGMTGSSRTNNQSQFYT